MTYYLPVHLMAIAEIEFILQTMATCTLMCFDVFTSSHYQTPEAKTKKNWSHGYFNVKQSIDHPKISTLHT